MNQTHSKFLKDFMPSLEVYSPGRINFIGEHTDYNNGYVLPTAIDKKIVFLLKENGSDDHCCIYSETYDSMFQCNLKTIEPSKQEWENYILGVLHELLLITDKVKGFDCVIKSELPVGAGISSSAALECGIAYGLNTLFDLKLSNLALVELCQRAEHHYVGTRCGIMDQFASVMSENGKVILLDCNSKEYRLIDANFEPYKILLLNTNVSHNLASSEYNKRREECEEVIRILSSNYPDVKSLREVSMTILNEYKPQLRDKLYQRATYVLEENQRVLDAAESLEIGDLKKFGQLMYESHRGLQNQYQVSCPELDFLVDFSEKSDYIIGCRMMGGGFGGCAIHLIHPAIIDDYIVNVKEAYKNQFNIDLTSFVTVPSGGTSILKS